MIKWEYKIITHWIPILNIDNFNELGEEGWELVSIGMKDMNIGTGYLVFKREKN
jgi:hypothetical protein